MRVPDIKTVDVFFEIFSNPEKLKKSLSEMRAIRDDIRSGLDMKDTKERLEKALAAALKDRAESARLLDQSERECSEASDLMVEKATQYEEEMRLERDAVSDMKSSLEAAKRDLDVERRKFEEAMARRESSIEETKAELEKALSAANAAKAEADEIVRKAKALVA